MPKYGMHLARKRVDKLRRYLSCRYSIAPSMAPVGTIWMLEWAIMAACEFREIVADFSPRHWHARIDVFNGSRSEREYASNTATIDNRLLQW
jgi:hypothetical protein